MRSCIISISSCVGGLAWWSDYWTNPKENAHLRERVLRYNEDDVRASFVLKDWLAAFCAPAE